MKNRISLKIKLFYNKTVPLILQKKPNLAFEMLHLQLRVLKKTLVNKITMQTIIL